MKRLSQPCGPASTRVSLRGRLLRPRAGGEPDQGAQAPSPLRPHLLLKGHGQPVPPAGAHRRLLAAARAAGSGAEAFILAHRPVRYHPPRPDQGRGPRYRDGDTHQNRAAVALSLSGNLDAARLPRRHQAALTHGAACPIASPSPQPATHNQTAPQAATTTHALATSMVANSERKTITR